eukprot:560540_1
MKCMDLSLLLHIIETNPPKKCLVSSKFHAKLSLVHYSHVIGTSSAIAGSTSNLSNVSLSVLGPKGFSTTEMSPTTAPRGAIEVLGSGTFSGSNANFTIAFVG